MPCHYRYNGECFADKIERCEEMNEEYKKYKSKLTALLKEKAEINEKQCTCCFTTKLTGDGCAVCNPEYAKQFEEDEIK